jgi:lysophospholipase L1-like esterase
MKKIFIILAISSLIGFIIFLFIKVYKKTNDEIKITDSDFIQHKNIYWGYGWKKKTDDKKKFIYSGSLPGSEFGFSFKDSDKISFSISSQVTAPLIGLEGWIDNNYFVFSYPSFKTPDTTLFIKKEDANKKHQIKARLFCYVIPYQPCDLLIKSIVLRSQAKILKEKTDRFSKIAILGDSISAVLGNENYTYKLAGLLNAHITNSSYDGSMVTNEQNDFPIPALARIENDIVPVKPNIILIFLGTNDLGKGVSLQNFKISYDKIIQTIRQKLPNVTIITVGLLPRMDIKSEKIMTYSSIIENISRQNNLLFINPILWLSEKDFSDGLHPNLSAQQKLAGRFYEILKNY